MNHFQLITIQVRIGGLPHVLKAVEGGELNGGGSERLLGCWTVEFGRLNRILVLRSSEAPLTPSASDPVQLGGPLAACRDHIEEVNAERFGAFPGLEIVEQGELGAFYELRTYWLRPGGLAPTLEAWRLDAPARAQRSPLVAAMFSLGGPSRILHLWPYRDLAARLEVRRDAVRDGIWPARGTPAWLNGRQSSELLLPTAFSPLR